MTAPTDCDDAALSEDKQRIVEYLQSQLKSGKQYLRSSEIGDSLGLSPKQVGAHLGQLDDEVDTLTIDKWGRHRSTTWYISAQDS